MYYMTQLPVFQATPVEVVEQRYSMIQSYLKKEMNVVDILDRFNITSPGFYKYLKRFNLYGKAGLQCLKRGSQVPHNRTANKQEEELISLHKNYPYFSSYELNELTGLNPRTIQRISKRHNLAKAYKPKSEKKRILERLKKELLKERREKKLRRKF